MKSPKNQPPKLAEKLLCWFLKPDLAEEVLGDLDEQFFATLSKKSAFAAKRNYWYQVFNYLRPFAIKKSRFNNSIQITMFKNNLKIAWRTLLKQKMYSIIKIGSFSIGIAASILITLYIANELSYDQHYAQKERIYRVVKKELYNGKVEGAVWFEAPMAKTLKEEFPEIEKAGRFNAGTLFGAGSNEVRRADQTINSHEKKVVYADQSLFDILQPEFVHGDPTTALASPNTIVITKSKSEKYFQDENPVGKRLIINENTDNPLTIGGVIEDIPANSHLDYELFITMTGREFWPGEQNYWNAQNYLTYVLLKPDTDISSLEKKMSLIKEKYILPLLISEGDVDAEEYVASISYELQPITDIHLWSDGIEDTIVNGDIKFVWLFGIIAIFIMIIASINFINLSTAKSANRAKEVGLRKVVGSHRINIIRQFLTESLLYSIVSFVTGITLAIILLPYFNNLAQKNLTIPFDQWWFFPSILMAAIVVGLLSGVYPSLYLSGFKPIEVLKGKVSMGSKSAELRSLLVVFQFTTSIVLIIGTVVIYQQVNYVLNKKLGYDKDQVLVLNGAGTMGDQIVSFKNELLQLSDVQYASIGDYLPVDGTKRNTNGFWKAGKTQEEVSVSGQFWQCDADYVETLGINMMMGRDFDPELASDSSTAIINETMARKMNWDTPIGQHITNGNSSLPQGYRIIGVMEDFHFESLKGEIGSLCIVLGNRPGLVTVKVKTQNIAGTIEAISGVWDKFSPNQPMRMNFLDYSYEMMYDDVKTSGYIFTSFAVLAIIVACLGLFALSAFMVEQRAKEIGIRLVLGASLNNIFKLLTVNFIKLVVISLLIASPISWLIMQNWLDDFKYSIDMSWDVFAIAGLVTIGIALLTISYESVKAGMASPSDSLRSE